MYDSYDYFDDLLKGSKTCKFIPLTKEQKSEDLIGSRNIVFKVKGESTSTVNKKSARSHKKSNESAVRKLFYKLD
jgi:hypothetical protein